MQGSIQAVSMLWRINSLKRMRHLLNCSYCVLTSNATGKKIVTGKAYHYGDKILPILNQLLYHTWAAIFSTYPKEKKKKKSTVFDMYSIYELSELMLKFVYLILNIHLNVFLLSWTLFLRSTNLAEKLQ